MAATQTVSTQSPELSLTVRNLPVDRWQVDDATESQGWYAVFDDHRRPVKSWLMLRHRTTGENKLVALCALDDCNELVMAETMLGFAGFWQEDAEDE